MNNHLSKINTNMENQKLIILFIANEKSLHCKSRLAGAKRLNFDSKNPILQRNCSKYTDVTVLKFHQDVYHHGALKQHYVN